LILRALATCFAAILAIAVGWSWLRTEREAAMPAAPVVESDSTTESSLALPAASADRAPGTDRREAGVEPPKPVQSAPELTTVRLHVMHGITGERLAGVRVQAQWGKLGERRILQSDDQGVAEVEVPPGTIFFSANHGELSGTAFFREHGSMSAKQEQPFELLLFPERVLYIQVVDGNGNPRAEVAVCLRTEGAPQQGWFTLDPGNPDPPMPTAIQEVWRGATAGQLGIARVEPLRLLLDDYYAALRAGRAATLFADLAFPTHPPAAVQIDPLQWPQAPVQLVLPELGSLTVVVLDSSGQPTSERAKVYVDAALPLERPSLRVGERDLESGRMLFDSVPYGLPLAVEVSFYGQRDAIRRKIDGPTHAQPELELVIVESSPMPVIVGRLVGASGAPIGLASVTVQSLNRAGEALSFGTYELKLTAGVFECLLATRIYEGGSVTLRFESAGLVATRELRSELTHLRIGLGDVKLEPAPQKASEKNASGGH